MIEDVTVEEVPDEKGSITFTVGGIEMVKLLENGDIFVRGKFCENDKDLLQSFRDFFQIYFDERDKKALEACQDE